MSKRERVAAALKGEQVDRPPISFWGHYPGDPKSAEGVAEGAVTFQQKCDWDFIKICASGSYYYEIFGTKNRFSAYPQGYAPAIESPIKTGADWERLPRPSPQETYVLRELIKSCTLIHKALPDVPCIQSVFSPLSVVDVLALEKGLPYHMQHHPKELHAALEMITEYTIPFARQCVEAGADGVFFAIRNASRRFFSDEQYLEFGKPYDLRILEAVRGAAFNMVHACQGGVQELMVDVLSDYPVHAMSWATEESFPSLREARVVWPRFCLVGGIDHHGLLTHGTTEQVKAAVRWAATCSGTRHMMVAGGCTIRLPHIEENLLAARQAIDEVRGS